MADPKPRPVGLTKDTGYQVGARRTFPVSLEKAWRFLTSPEGVALWLGASAPVDLSKGARYELKDGASGEVRVFKPNSHLRITWFPPGYPRASLIQVRVIPSKDRVVVSFHQEHLPGPDARADRREFFLRILDQLGMIFQPD